MFHLSTLLLAQITDTDALFKAPVAGTRLYFRPESLGLQSPVSRAASGFSRRVIELTCVVDGHREEGLSFGSSISLLFLLSLMRYVTKPSLAEV